MTTLPPSHVQQLFGKRDRAHDRAYDRERADDVAKRIRSSARWREVRRLQLSREPLCRACAARGETTAAAEVDHIVPIRERPDLAFTRTNLQSLCEPCHGRKSGEERRHV